MSTSSMEDGTDDVDTFTERELPDDVLADVLRRLAPRSLGVSRCVRRGWRDVVDARRLLRADLLPHAVGGIFIEYCLLCRPEFLARPSTGPPVAASLDFMPQVCRVVNHCNGLLLCTWYDKVLHVVNPATRRFARLPPCPPPHPHPREVFYQAACLAYDPTVSPHYEVYMIPHVPQKPETKLDDETLQSEWPPLRYTMHVFSSTNQRWQEASFVRQGEAAGTVAEIKSNYIMDVPYHAAYWKGALYVHCQDNDFITRISLQHAKYQIVKTPTDTEAVYYPDISLGRSEKGVYCAICHSFHRVSIWLLSESCDRMEWSLKHRANFVTFARKLHACEENGQQTSGPWVLNDVNYYYASHRQNDDLAAVKKQTFEWDSDDDDVLDTDNMVEGRYEGHTGVLGFHPYKEVIFLNASLRSAVAYHWNTSKFQYLGDVYPKDYADIAGHVAEIDMSFVYTPCWLEEFPGTNFEAQIED